MALTREAKEIVKENLAERFVKANATIVAEYSGIGVGELTELRVKLREVDAEFKIIKNRLAKLAIKEKNPDSEPLVDSLKGPVGVVFMYGDAGAATKSVLEFHKSVPEKFKICAGMMDGRLVDKEELSAIAELPSKDVLIAKILGSMVAPHKGLLNVMNGVPEKFVRVLSAIGEKKEA